jgi:hypothetical protein
MREFHNVKTTIQIITNPRHPIRPFCVDTKRTDEYTYRPATPICKDVGNLGKLQIDPRRIEKTPQHIRPPWMNTTNEQPATTVSARKQPAHTGRRIKTPNQNLHGWCQEGRKSRLLSDLEPPKNNKKITTSKHNLQCRTISNHNRTAIHSTIKEPGR